MNTQAQQFAGNQAQLTQQAMLASMGALNNQNQFQAGLYQQTNQANQQAQLAQASLNAQQYNNYMNLLQQQTYLNSRLVWQKKLKMLPTILAQGIDRGVACSTSTTKCRYCKGGMAALSALFSMPGTSVLILIQNKI